MISTNYPPFFTGPDLQAHKINKRLFDFNMNIFVLTKNFGINRNVFENVEIFSLPAKTKLTRPSKTGMIIWVLSVISFLFINRKKYQIVHLLSGFTNSAIITFVAGFFLKKPVIVKNSLAKGAFQRDTLIKKLNIAIFKKYAHVVAISIETKRELEKLGFHKNKIIFIPNGVDLDIFFPVQSVEKIALRKKLLLDPYKMFGIFTGFLNERKDISLLIKSLNHIIKKTDNFHLLLAGKFSNSTFENHIMDIIKKENLTQYVTFLGKRDDIDELLKTSDIFLFASKREGLPNALLEAMACGLPTIAFSIGGIKDIIVNNYNGIILEEHQRDPQKFAEKVIYLLQTNEILRKFSQNSVSTIRKKFNISETVEKYKDLYNSLIKDNNEG